MIPSLKGALRTFRPLRNGIAVQIYLPHRSCTGRVGNGSIVHSPFRKAFSSSAGEEWWEGEGAGEGVEDSTTNEPQETPRPQRTPRRIHILGLGNVGKFVAHSLAGMPNNPPISLLFHTSEVFKHFRRSGEKLELETNGMTEVRRGFQSELMEDYTEDGDAGFNEQLPQSTDEAAPEETDGHITNLIVCVKASYTVRALEQVKHRLGPDSTIVFLQNGMGIMEEVNEKVFPDIEARPHYMQGVVSHGIYRKDVFHVVHAGMGTISLGLLPRRDRATPKENDDSQEIMAPSSRYMLRTLTRVPVLAAVGFSRTDLLQLQLEKLSVNAIVNPLTVLLDCKNGALLYSISVSRVMRLLLAEISTVIRALPELQGIPNVQMRFSPERLETQVVGVATQTAENVSSMLQDTNNARLTEIKYITGYIVKRGEDMGIKCVMNYMIMQLIMAKGLERQRIRDNALPFEMAQKVFSDNQ